MVAGVQTPVDFVIDVLLLQRGRVLTDEVMAGYGLPTVGHSLSKQGCGVGPCLCSDWVPFVIAVLTPGMLMGVPDLRERILSALWTVARSRGVVELASNEPWSEEAGRDPPPDL